MLAFVLSALAILGMVVCLLAIPFGLPGVWGMVAIAAVATLAGSLSGKTLLLLALVAAIAEVAEFFAVKKMGAKYGGSKKAFWGAIAGGIVGALVGTPIPVIGSVVGVFAGTFAGAAGVTLLEGSGVANAGGAGWGALLGRALAVALKGAAGVLVLVTATTALIF